MSNAANQQSQQKHSCNKITVVLQQFAVSFLNFLSKQLSFRAENVLKIIITTTSLHCLMNFKYSIHTQNFSWSLAEHQIIKQSMILEE